MLVQIGSSPQLRGEKEKIFELPPPRKVYLKKKLQFFMSQNHGFLPFFIVDNFRGPVTSSRVSEVTSSEAGPGGPGSSRGPISGEARQKPTQKKHPRTGIFTNNVGLYIYIYIIGVSKNSGTPKTPQKWSFLEGKPIVVGYHHFRKPPYVNIPYMDDMGTRWAHITVKKVG